MGYNLLDGLFSFYCFLNLLFIISKFYLMDAKTVCDISNQILFFIVKEQYMLLKNNPNKRILISIIKIY